MEPSNTKSTFSDLLSKDSNYSNYDKDNSALVLNSSNENYNYNRTTNRIAHYITNPKELKEEHPILHYFYLCSIIFAAFVSIFIGPVIFGMLAAIGGLATPFVLSLIGSALGLIFGVVFGVVFSVVCIVALVKALGCSAEWVLDTLWYGGNDLMEITKQQIFTYISPPRRHHQL